MLAISDEVGETRHFLRNEFTAELVKLRADVAGIGQMVQAGNLAQVTENARMQATLEDVKHGLAGVRSDVDVLQTDVGLLKAKSLAADEVAKLKRWVVGAALMPSLAILATVVLYLAQH
jgi:hypothetical protein